MDNFIPKAEAEKVKGRALFDEETNKWTLTPLGVKYERPNAVFHNSLQFFQVRFPCSQASIEDWESETHLRLCQDGSRLWQPQIPGPCV